MKLTNKQKIKLLQIENSMLRACIRISAIQARSNITHEEIDKVFNYIEEMIKKEFANETNVE